MADAEARELQARLEALISRANAFFNQNPPPPPPPPPPQPPQQMDRHMSVKRDYKLGKDTRLELWFDLLKSELIAYNLFDVIDTKEGKQPEVSDEKKRQARDVIVNRIEEIYHRRVVNIEDPCKILRELKEFKRCESNSTSSSVRAKLYAIRMKPKEGIFKFAERFDEIVREHSGCQDGAPLSEKEIRDAFYEAVVQAVPEIRTADLTGRLLGKKEMNVDEMKMWAARIEAESGVSQSHENPVARQANIKCFRCNEVGHPQQECDLIRRNLWFCYKCKTITDHKSDSCNKGNSYHQRGRGNRGNRGNRGGPRGGPYNDNRGNSNRGWRGGANQGNSNRGNSNRGGRGGKPAARRANTGSGNGNSAK